MLNIVIPMAGLGSRFDQAGYDVPKPLIPVHGIPMIQVVVDNLRPSQPHRFIFVCQRSHCAESDIVRVLRTVAPDSKIVETDGVTAGAACTVMLTGDYIDNETPLMIANCDQWVNYRIDDYLAHAVDPEQAGLIMTMKSSKTKWSYVQRNETREIVAVVEKKVVSDEATVGIYNFARGADFVRAAEEMILADDRVNHEFYVAPVYTRLVQSGKKIGTLSIGTDRDGMYGLGTPSDLEFFLQAGFEKRLKPDAFSSAKAA